MTSPAPATGVLRLTRAAVLSLATVSLSLGAHVAAGGRAPGVVGLLLTLVPVLAVSLLATGRRLGLGSVAALVAATQLALHTAFMTLAMGGRDGASVTTGHHAHLLLGASGASSATPAGGSGPSSLLDVALLGSSPAMTLGHVVAAALVALLLARGETALWSLWSWLRPSLPVATPLVVPLGGRVDTTPRAMRSLARSARPRPRGPPRRLLPTVPAADRQLAAPA